MGLWNTGESVMEGRVAWIGRRRVGTLSRATRRGVGGSVVAESSAAVE